jgi:hypothetical protein
MEQHVSSDLFPPGFPSELARAAFVDSKEAAWRPSLAAASVEWFGANGYAVLGTELWIPKHGSIQSLPYFQHVDRKAGEAWDAFVARAAIETLAYFKAFSSNFAKEGDVYVNVTWVSEAEFEKFCSGASPRS